MFDLTPDIDHLTLLKFKDFVPNRTAYNQWTGNGKYEPLAFALQAVNVWIAENPHTEILNVETVVLPNIHSKKEEGSEDPEVTLAGHGFDRMNQFFRVWYIERPESATE